MPEFPVAGGYQEEVSIAIGVAGTLTPREYKADFDSPVARLEDGLSTDRRPDSISYDYLTAFSLGPIQLGDFSAGPINRAWKIRVSGNTVFSSRQNDAGNGFEDEQIVFTFTGLGATEIDVAFDQSAHILVCMERPTGVGGSSEIWIYYYDPFITNFTLANFGRGRTPRAVLDDILDSSNADILVFYLVDSVGMCWRQQRIVSKRDYGAVLDFPETVYYAEVETWNSFFGGGALRAIDENGAVVNEFTFGPGDTSGTRQLAYVYSQTGFRKLQFLSSSQDSRKWANVRYSTSQIPGAPIPTPLDLANTYLEDVYKATSGRVVIIYSVRDPVAGTYKLDTIGTVLYPQVLPTEKWTSFKTVPLSGILLKILRFLMPPGAVDPDGNPPDAFDQIDEWKTLATTPASGILRDTIISHTLFDIDEWQSPAAIPTSGTLVVVIIPHTLFDVDEWQSPAAIPLSGVLFLAIIDHHLFDIDEWKSTATIPVSGTLV
jgi:hypothetical protein